MNASIGLNSIKITFKDFDQPNDLDPFSIAYITEYIKDKEIETGKVTVYLPHKWRVQLVDENGNVQFETP